MSLIDLWRKVTIFTDIASLVYFLIFFIFFIILLSIFKIFHWILLIIIGFVILFVILTIITIKRKSSINLEERKIKDIIKQTSKSKSKYKNERIIGTIYGVLRSFRTGLEMLGIGKVSNPENSIMVTNHRILFIAVPVTGEGKSIEGLDISEMHYFFNKKGIEKKGKLMIARMTPQQILNSYPINYEIPFTKIKEIKISSWWSWLPWGNGSISFKTASAKYKYIIKRKEDIKKIKNILNKYLPNKIR